jgi:hypothetical protein
MASKFVYRWFRAGLGKYKVDTGTFRTKIEEHESNRYVDFDDFAKQLTKIYEELDSEGYELINVVPITMGQETSPTAGMPVAFSITRGAVVIGKKIS